MNKQAASEWLTIAYHDLKSAQILYDAEHYTDSIGSDLQQSIEKILKSTLAFENKKIPKTHDLYEVYDLVTHIDLADNEINFLYLATEYLKEDRYPNPHYSLPSREEIKEVLYFCETLFHDVCRKLTITKEELLNEMDISVKLTNDDKKFSNQKLKK